MNKIKYLLSSKQMWWSIWLFFQVGVDLGKSSCIKWHFNWTLEDGVRQLGDQGVGQGMDLHFIHQGMRNLLVLLSSRAWSESIKNYLLARNKDIWSKERGKVRSQWDVHESGSKILDSSELRGKRGAGRWKKGFRGRINSSEVGGLTNQTEPMMFLRF